MVYFWCGVRRRRSSGRALLITKTKHSQSRDTGTNVENNNNNNNRSFLSLVGRVASLYEQILGWKIYLRNTAMWLFLTNISGVQADTLYHAQTHTHIYRVTQTFVFVPLSNRSCWCFPTFADFCRCQFSAERPNPCSDSIYVFCRYNKMRCICFYSLSVRSEII